VPRDRKSSAQRICAGRVSVRVAIAALVLGVVAGFLFLAFPRIDLQVSRAFYDGNGEFSGQSLPWVKIVRNSFAFAFYACVTATLMGAIMTWRRTRAWLRLGFKQWMFLAVCLVVGPGLIANVVFKDHWGRARPRQTVEFGGSKAFTPPLIPADQCAKNCSFVSGEAAATFLPFYATGLLVPEAAGLLFAAGTLVGGASGLVRLSQGAHFLSDIVFAGIFMSLTVVLAYWAMWGIRVTNGRVPEPQAGEADGHPDVGPIDGSLSPAIAAQIKPSTAVPQQALELSVIVPTFNEAGNVRLLVARLSDVLAGIRWEVIFVDDNSPDGTAATARQLARVDPRVRCLRRIGRRGLAGASIEGMLSSSAEVVAVMDGDLQHDETQLPRMLAAIRQGADLVVGTRFAEGGSAAGGFSQIRQLGSLAAAAAARRMLGVDLSDPMSGFFMIRREKFDLIAPRLSSYGFKVLLDIVASSRGQLGILEVPFVFRARCHGESKLDGLAVAEYLGLLLAKLSGDRIPIRFVLFALVGATGLVVHLAALREALSLGLGFNWAQAIASYVAMTSNFILNNQLTYRDRRLTGFAALRGVVTFYAACSTGALANVGVADWIYGSQPTWWLAGTAGALMGLVFNYATTAAFTWRQN
jgi:dolichol-phosphate mannosyltransferase